MAHKTKATTKAKAKLKTRPFDVAEYLDNPVIIAGYLTEAFETHDPKFIAHAISDVVRAKGMTRISEKTGFGRESLYKSFNGKTKTQFETVQKVLDAMDLAIEVKPKEAA